MPVKPKKQYPDIFTGEVFKYEYEPANSAEPSYIVNTESIKLFRQDGKCYIYDSAELTEINEGSYNSAIQVIAGLSDEAAAAKIKTMFRSGSIKKAKSEIFYKKKYQRL